TDYCRANWFVGEIKGASRDIGQRVDMEVSRQTRDIIASPEELTRAHIVAQQTIASEVTGAINEGNERLSYELRDISAGIPELNATFHWGFGQMIASLGRMNDSLEALVKIAKTPVQTMAFHHFEIARDAFRQGLYREALEELDKAVKGDHTSPGYKLEWRFHYLQGIIRLGFVDGDLTLVDLGKAEEAFLNAARYARKDYPEDAGRAFLSAGWACYCQGKMTEALAHTEKAMSVHPCLGEAVFQASKILMALGNVDRALPLLGKAIEHDRFYALKAAGDGDYQRNEPALRGFLEALRKEKYRQALHEIDKALDAIQGYRLSGNLADVKNHLERFRSEGGSLPLMDILARVKEWRQWGGGFLTKELPGITIQIEDETQEEEQEEYPEKIITSPAGLFRKEEYRMGTRTRKQPITSQNALNKTIEVIRDEWTPTIGGKPDCAWEFCLIPAGSFMMGEKGSQHKVTLTHDFYLGRHPVTQRQWEAVMGNNPSSFKGVQDADRPVENVSWEDVQRYTQKLNELAGESRYHLPTEAQWEYACRAGSNG
ncbi:MAG: SUMF1/EgtB/PvdO family nonheme iron enzyme, partial [Deltaproteobacteria bacterium]